MGGEALMILDETLDESFDDRIDLTPMIDAVFLLLIFFVMATTFSKPVMDIVVPRAESSRSSNLQKKQILISIDGQGRIFWEHEEISREELAERMNRHPERVVNFCVDERAPFRAFIEAFDQARLKRRDEILITTDREKSKPNGPR